MTDGRFHNSSNIVNAFEVAPDDPEFLRLKEFTFIFFTPSLPKVRLLYDKRENYQRGRIEFSVQSVSAVEMMGRPCVHCKEALTSVGDCCVAVNSATVVAVVHESCFRKWFNASDKGQISPYRLVRARRRKIAVEGSSFKILVGDGEEVDEYSFSALYPVKMAELAHDPMTGTIIQQGGYGFTGTPPQGMSHDEYMTQMQTLVQADALQEPKDGAGLSSPKSAWFDDTERSAGAVSGPDKTVERQETGAASVLETPMVSRAYKTTVNCPHCNVELTITIETKQTKS